MRLLFDEYVGNTWQERWEQFKSELPHQRKPYSKRNWGDALHSLCSYQGKMKPSLAYHLVTVFTEPGQRLLDPFAGVGTIPLEAALCRVTAFGFDISPAALAIAKAKTSIHSANECEQYLNELELFLKTERVVEEDLASAQKMSFNSSIPDCFHPQTLNEILLARRFFLMKPPVSGTQNLVFSSMLHILHGNRPYALSRRSHPITPYKPTGDFVYKPLMRHLRDKVYRSLRVYIAPDFVPACIVEQDATTRWPEETSELDVIITSPPFFDSTRFHIGNWMRLWFSGWERDDFRLKPQEFVDERQKVGFGVYIPILKQAHERLKPPGVFVLHLGLSRKADMATEISQLAEEWFDVFDLFTEDVTHTEKHGLRDKGTVKGHQYLVLTPKH